MASYRKEKYTNIIQMFLYEDWPVGTVKGCPKIITLRLIAYCCEK
jgi:hypothetical protein